MPIYLTEQDRTLRTEGTMQDAWRLRASLPPTVKVKLRLPVPRLWTRITKELKSWLQ